MDLTADGKPRRRRPGQRRPGLRRRLGPGNRLARRPQGHHPVDPVQPRRQAAGGGQLPVRHALERPDRRPGQDLHRPRRPGQGAGRRRRRQDGLLGGPGQDDPRLGRRRGQADPPVRPARAPVLALAVSPDGKTPRRRWPGQPRPRPERRRRQGDRRSEGTRRAGPRTSPSSRRHGAWSPSRPTATGRIWTSPGVGPTTKPAEPIVLNGHNGAGPRRRRHTRRPDDRRPGARTRRPALARGRRHGRRARSTGITAPVLALAVSPGATRC